MTPILELQGLSFRYEGGLPGEKVLDALTFAVAPGERVGLVGCNGVGKSKDIGVAIPAFLLPIVEHVKSQVEDKADINKDSGGE